MENKDNSPLVSVIMATYNEPQALIKQAIDSILKQTYNNIELIIADDSTKEETINTIDEAASSDNRVVIVRKLSRMGFVNALNFALQTAKGELIARMDGDDVSISDRIEKQVNFARQHPDCDVFGGSMNIINEKGDIISERNYPSSALAFKRMFVFRNPLAHPTIMFRRKIIDNGFFYDPQFKKAEDLEFYLRLYKNGFKICNMQDKLLNYRVVGDLRNKREHDNWYYNHKARTKNFIITKPIFSSLSWLVSLAYEFAPKSIISYIYNRENSKVSH